MSGSGTEQRLLVLGAGRHQKGLIARAEERGVRVVVSDYYADSPGKQYASYPTMTDALDVEANIALGREYGVAGVITTGTDQAVVPMAEVASALGLPCYISAGHARVATNKVAMKEAFERVGVPTARYVAVRDPGQHVLDGLGLPVVIKPADSQGQRGTRRVERRAEVAAAIEEALAASRSSTAIVEELIDGRELTISAWLEDGEPRTLLVSDRVTYNPPPAIGICFQHVTPSRRIEGHEGEVEPIVSGVARAFGMDRGPLYIQVLVDGRGVYVVEAAARVGGGHEASLIPLVRGVDVTDRLIDLALEGRCAPIAKGARPVHALVNFLMPRPGTIAEVRGMDEAISRGLAVEGEFYRDVGYRCERVENGQGRIGYFITEGQDAGHLQRRARECYESLALVGDNGENLLYWPDDPLLA